MPRIVVFGKTGCGKCASALDKLRRLGLPFVYVPLDDPAGTEQHLCDGEGWRKAPVNWRAAGVTADLAAVQEIDIDANHPPILVLDGQPHDYPSAMKALKSGGEAP